MNRALTIARIIGALCFAAFCLAGSLAALQMREIAISEANNLDSLTQHVVATVNDVDDTVNDLHTGGRQAFTEINRPCKGKDCGILASADKLLIKGGDILATTQLNENREAALVNVELPGLIAESRKTLSAYQQTGEALTAATERLQPVEDNAALALHSASDLINDPAIREEIDNFNAASLSTANTMKHLDGTSADVQVAVHGFLHPGWKARIVNWISQAAHTAGGWF